MADRRTCRRLRLRAGIARALLLLLLLLLTGDDRAGRVIALVGAAATFVEPVPEPRPGLSPGPPVLCRSYPLISPSAARLCRGRGGPINPVAPRPPSRRRRRPPRPPCPRLSAASYGRGAEIWPPVGDVPVRLEDSFPGGVVPPDATSRILSLSVPEDEEEDDDGSTGEGDGGGAATTGGRRPRRGGGRIWRILRRAARFERDKSSDPPAPTDGRSAEEVALDASRPSPVPPTLAVLLVALGLVRSTEILFALAFGGYLILLTKLGRTEMGGEDGGGYRRVPTLPPQGHVPSLVSNPLGHRWTSSGGYRAWLRTGAVLGLLAPLVATGCYLAGGRSGAARSCAGPVFLICCQALTEAVSRRAMAPLPVRILIPVAYNARRLGLIWDWALSSTPLGRPGRALAIANLIYWAVNLFGFLLPVASMRYLRAHFFCVEASEVAVREGHEDAVGLLPRS